MAKKIDPLNKKQYGAVSTMLRVSGCRGLLSKGFWLYQARHHERTRWQAHTRGADIAWHDFDAGAGENPALGKRQR
jgi:hypothetical protein